MLNKSLVFEDHKSINVEKLKNILKPIKLEYLDKFGNNYIIKI